MSYYEMKNRAGVVGQNGLGPLLASLRGPSGPPRIHLMGHSFGARLVSYTLAGLPASQTGSASPVKSLTLIQGAFSHFTFASSLMFDPSRAGGLAGDGSRVDGPLLATFSAADRAVGWWYPAASMLAGQDSESATDLVFRWGGMGHDGYQQTPSPTTVVLAPQGTPYGFTTGCFYSLDANAVICANQSPFSGAHSDIQHPEVLWAVVAAAGLGA
jgi:pimeloyl-ACP methyl ester carboxylesterase